MLTRRTPYSSALIHVSATQHRGVATKLAPKWQPQQPSTASPPTAKPFVPAPKSWALPRNGSGPSMPAASANPSQWAFPDMRPTRRPPPPGPPLPRQRSARPNRPTLTPPPKSLSGKWTRPRDVPDSPHTSPIEPDTSSSSRIAAAFGSYDRLRRDRDPAPHIGRYSDNNRPANLSRGPNTNTSWRRDARDSFVSSRGETAQKSRPQSVQNSRSNHVDLDPRNREPANTSRDGVDERIKSFPSNELESPDDQTQTRLRRNLREPREKFKTRGSLLKGGEIERRPRVSNLRSHIMKKPKQKRKVIVTEDVYIPMVVSVSQLARILGIRLDYLRRKMIEIGMAAESSYDHVLNSEDASMIAFEFNKNPIVDDEAAFDIFPPPPHPDPSSLPQRPPVVTIMGHVDHGKTTLLDTLRSTSVAKNEAGGITQHIGAFSVPVPTSSSGSGQTITFLDTPGHAAFSAMRARGASVTDIVVLVVAADDGIMPQTKEVIDLIGREAGKVGVVVAINKTDKPGVDVEAVQHALLTEGVHLEGFGGDVPSVEVSGLTGQGLDRLVETISAVAEMADYRAEQTGSVFGYVLESKILKGLGPVATVLVLRGSLTTTKHLISGAAHARVRQLSDSAGKVVKVAHPGTAVIVSGWKDLPDAGDEVLEGAEADIKKAIANRKRRAQLAAVVHDAAAINLQRKLEREEKEDSSSAVPLKRADNEPKEESSGPKKLFLVIKGDVSGSVEAVAGALQGIGNAIACVKIIHSSVGSVTESDVMLAKTAGAMIVAFSVGVPRAVENMAGSQDVTILTSSVIYHLMDDVKQKVIEMLPPIMEKRVLAEATVQQLFDIQSKRRELMKVAGCRITNGTLEKNKAIRVMRQGDAVFEGSINTFRHLKKDVLEARKDMECGISLHEFDDLRIGDVVQSIQIIQKPGIL